MENNNTINKPKKLVRKFLLYGLLSIIVILFISHWVWKSSGTGEWEFVHEIDGVVVHSMKEPGSVIMKYKVNGKFKSSLSGIMKLMRDPDSCEDVGCNESYIIDKEDYPRFVHYTFRYDMPDPFLPREFVVLSEFHQDPESKEIYVDYKAAVDKLPPNDCCVRVTHMHNIWKFKPLGNGEVEVEFIMDNHPGGMLPYFLVNAEFTDTMHLEIPALQEILDKKEYQAAKVDYVMEYDEVAAVEVTSAE
ncbi:hypothetical protein [Aliikangiella coralliicola]|uniref:START domain-containing protein n=1 Tax=Aliikangiella coralliicola TaxID=2592383 RepID=A0A545U963_9GAMM|nr:hypothetical protein [Aliikangiella coralliicola]TQV86005.1 hypothetical protein FLL46_19025 [Aliikangiella coralliicola]